MDAAKASSSGLKRSVESLSDLRLSSKGLYVGRTDTHIRLDGSFFRSLSAGLFLYLNVHRTKLGRCLSGKKPNGKIAFHPQPVSPWYNAWTVSQLAGYKIVSDPDAADHIFVFEDETTHPQAALPISARHKPTINHRANDISKDRVARIFQDVFGYDLAIDPLNYQGRAVQKSQVNGAHDGVEIQCPIPECDVLPGHAYQKLIDSTYDGKTSEDLRFVYVFGEIPIVFKKKKPLDDRFGTTYLHVDCLEAEDAFSQEEISLLAKFCERMGLDFGAVDAMRDKHDGRVYVVDVNKTCMPVLSLTLSEQMMSYRRIAEAFYRGLETPRKA